MTAELGQRLTQLRQAAGLSIDRMAAELGLSSFDVSAVKASQRVFTEARPLVDWLSVCGADAEKSSLLDLWQAQALAAGVEF
jgi:transcriptional regulator with XRE-family HTH domain